MSRAGAGFTTKMSARNNKQPRRKVVEKQKKEMEKSQIKDTTDILPTKRKTLLEELRHQQKKSRLSDFKIPHDSVTNTPDFARELDGKECTQLPFQESETIPSAKENNNSQNCIKYMDCYHSGKKYDKEQHGLYNKVTELKHRKNKSSNKETCKTSSPSVVPLSTPEEVSLNEQKKQRLSPQTARSMKEVSASENQINDKSKNESVSEKHKNILQGTSDVSRKKYNTDPTPTDIPCKNHELEWNTENMKLIFGIDVPDEIINPETKTTGDEKLSASLPSFKELNSPTYGVPRHIPQDSTEYLYYLHELALAGLKKYDCIKEMDCYDSRKRKGRKQDRPNNKVSTATPKKRKTTNKKSSKTSSKSDVRLSMPEKVTANEQKQQTLSSQTVGSMKEVSVSENPIKDKYKKETVSDKHNNSLKETSGVSREKYNTDPIPTDIPGKNHDLEWNREKMKLIFETDVPNEIINAETNTTGDENFSASLPSYQDINSATYEVPTDIPQGSAEYLDYLHELPRATRASLKENDCIKNIDYYDSGKRKEKKQDHLFNKVTDEKHKKKKSTNKKTSRTSFPSIVPLSKTEKVLVNEETQQTLSPQTAGSMKEVSVFENPISEKSKNESESEKHEDVLKQMSRVSREKNYSDPIFMDIPCENLELEWNKEIRELLFGIDVLDDTGNPDSKTTGDEENNNFFSTPLPSSSGMLNFNPSTNEVSNASEEYLFHFHELDVTKCTEHGTESTSKDTINNNVKELLMPISKNNDNKFTGATRDTSTPHTSSYYQNDISSATRISKQRYDPQGQSAELKANEAPIESTSMARIWAEHSGAYTVPNDTLNLTSYNNIPLNLHQNSTNLRQHDDLRSVQPPAISRSSNPAVIPDSSASCNVNSTIQPMAHHPNISHTQNWMMKPPANISLVQHLSQGFSTYGHPSYRNSPQKRARFEQCTFLPHAANVNNYLNPAHTLMMNDCMHYGMYNTANAATVAMMSGMPYNLYPMTESSQHQPMHRVPPRLYPNFTGPSTAAAPSDGTTMQPPQAKRRKLEGDCWSIPGH